MNTGRRPNNCKVQNCKAGKKICNPIYNIVNLVNNLFIRRLTMKNAALLNGFFCLLVLLLSGCEKNQTEYHPNSGNGRIRQIQLYNIDSRNLIGIVKDYEYDEQGRVSKTTSPMYVDGKVTGIISYDLYEYDSHGRLSKIENYNASSASPDGFINLYNKNYEYSGTGELEKESVDFPVSGMSEYTFNEYRDGILVESKKYTNNELETYVVFNYDTSGKLKKEETYLANGRMFNYTIHSYSGSSQVQSDLYISPANTHFRTIKRIFDGGNNLITLESRELSVFSSMSSYVMRYLYY